MKLFLMIIGIFALAMGLLWVGQGLGYVRWPESSFMISQVKWTYYGAAVGGVGVLFIAIACYKK
ncbi:MAG: hypothetical protein P4M14_01740 [Gammaproteobacteria bacterium]|nr:hypothetical protein [Gammaproteobacteria bacterium]